MKKYLFFLLSSFPALLFAQKNYQIQGHLIDSVNQTPVDYANIGIQGKNLGTVSNDSGFFKLEIPDNFLEDSLTISRIGFYPKRIKSDDLISSDFTKILLNPKSTEIAEAKIVSTKLKKQKKGNRFRPSIIQSYFSFSTDFSNLGHEVGIAIDLPEKPVSLKDFNFHIYNVRADSVKLRLNIYEFNNGNIGDNILKKNIYVVITKNDRGNYCVDLSDYEINVSGDIVVSIENIEAYTSNSEFSDKNRRMTIMLSSSISGSKGYGKITSLSNWNESQSPFSPDFWVTILK